jgi:WD40 repeat-containing protein SMU1
MVIRILGIKSGNILKELKGHTSFVNEAIFSKDYSKILSCSSDATIKVRTQKGYFKREKGS